MHDQPVCVLTAGPRPMRAALSLRPGTLISGRNREIWKVLPCSLPVSTGFGVTGGLGLKTVWKFLEKIFLPIFLVPLVRSYWHGEWVKWVPLGPQLLPACLSGTFHPGTEDSRQWAPKASRLGFASFPCSAQRIQTCFANVPLSLRLNCI